MNCACIEATPWLPLRKRFIFCTRFFFGAVFASYDHPQILGQSILLKVDHFMYELTMSKISLMIYSAIYSMIYSTIHLFQPFKADRISEATSRKVSEARLVRALIMLSQDISDEKIIKALKEVWYFRYLFTLKVVVIYTSIEVII